MKIRRYRDGDAEGIIRMINDVMGEFGESFDPDLDRDLLDIPRYYGNKGAFWVLTDGKKIAGSIALSRITDEVCKFRRFYIDKDYRGKGWGVKLFKLRANYAAKLGYKEAWMVTSAHHKAVIDFVKKRGAVRSRKRLFPTRRAHMFFIYNLHNEKTK